MEVMLKKQEIRQFKQQAYAAYLFLLPRWRRKWWPWLSRAEKEQAMLFCFMVNVKGKAQVRADMEAVALRKNLSPRQAMADLAADRGYWDGK